VTIVDRILGPRYDRLAAHVFTASAAWTRAASAAGEYRFVSSRAVTAPARVRWSGVADRPSLDLPCSATREVGAENFFARAKSADAPGADGDTAHRARDRRDDLCVAVIPGHARPPQCIRTSRSRQRLGRRRTSLPATVRAAGSDILSVPASTTSPERTRLVPGDHAAWLTTSETIGALTSARDRNSRATTPFLPALKDGASRLSSSVTMQRLLIARLLGNGRLATRLYAMIVRLRIPSTARANRIGHTNNPRRPP